MPPLKTVRIYATFSNKKALLTLVGRALVYLYMIGLFNTHQLYIKNQSCIWWNYTTGTTCSVTQV